MCGNPRSPTDCLLRQEARTAGPETTEDDAERCRATSIATDGSLGEHAGSTRGMCLFTTPPGHGPRPASPSTRCPSHHPRSRSPTPGSTPIESEMGADLSRRASEAQGFVAATAEARGREVLDMYELGRIPRLLSSGNWTHPGRLISPPSVTQSDSSQEPPYPLARQNRSALQHDAA